MVILRLTVEVSDVLGDVNPQSMVSSFSWEFMCFGRFGYMLMFGLLSEGILCGVGCDFPSRMILYFHLPGTPVIPKSWGQFRCIKFSAWVFLNNVGRVNWNPVLQFRGCQALYVEVKIVNISGSVGHLFSVAIPQLFLCGVKAIIDSM